jgi:triacylglycerol lipase
MNPWVLALLIVLVVALVAAGGLYLWRRRVVRARVARRALTPFNVPRLPVVLVHGIMGFDEIGPRGLAQHYFRGVADSLIARGVTVYRPRLPPVASVPARAAALAAFVRGLPSPMCHLIAHSMGGLDARYAISRLGLSDRVVSLTTIGTPHRGTPLAELACNRPATLVRRVIAKVGGNSEGFEWLTPAALDRFNLDCVDHPRVWYASVVSRAPLPANPLLWASWHYLRGRSGDSDGIVPTASQHWGHTLAEIDSHHWAQVGWATGDAMLVYEQILAALAEREHVIHATASAA